MLLTSYENRSLVKYFCATLTYNEYSPSTLIKLEDSHKQRLPNSTWECSWHVLSNCKQEFWSAGVISLANERPCNCVVHFTHSKSVEKCTAGVHVMAWNCVLCGFSAFYLFLLLSHINTSHNDDNYFAFCGISGCDRNFQKANSFSRHVREKHGAYLKSQREDVVLEKLRNGSGEFTDDSLIVVFLILADHSECCFESTLDLGFFIEG